jgi:Flp pilus assembly protein TadG
VPLPLPFRRFLRGRRGNVLVEFAIITPLLAILMCAIIDFALAMFTLNNLTNAVRQGARAAAIRSAPISESTVQTEVCAALSMSFTGTCTSLVSLDTSQYRAAAGVLKVKITNYPYTPVTPLAPLFRMSTVNMTREAVFRWEFSNP